MTIAERLYYHEKDELCDALYRLTGEDRQDLRPMPLAALITLSMQKTPEQLRQCLGKRTLEMMAERISSGRTLVTFDEADVNYLLLRSMDDLTAFGLCSEVEEGWKIDPDALPLTQAGRAEELDLERQEMIFVMMDGMLACRGMMEINVLYEQLARMLPVQSVEEVGRLLTARYGLRATCRAEAAEEDGPDEIWACYPDLDDADLLLAALETPETAALPYADLSVDRLVYAHAYGYPADAAQIDACAQALMSTGLTEAEAFSLITEAIGDLENSAGAHSGQEAALAAGQEIGIPLPDGAFDALRSLCDGLPRWNLKSHTPAEAQRLIRASRISRLRHPGRLWDSPEVIPFPTVARKAGPIAPDAPCPCGSGRPYGECHGLKQ